MRQGSGRWIGRTLGGTALGWLVHGLVEQRRLANRDAREQVFRPRRGRPSRRGFYGRVRELTRAQARGGRGAFWTGLAALLLRRSVFQDLRRTLVVGALLGAAGWAGGWLGLLDTADPHVRRGARSVARTGASLLGQIAYGIVSVLPLYASARFESAKRAGSSAWQTVRAT
jgi:hypothetical protein